jgi:hypothetical protein
MYYLGDQGIAQWADAKKYSSSYKDGVEPALLVTDEWRQTVLRDLRGFQQRYGLLRPKHRKGFPYANFLRSRPFIEYADGVHDPNSVCEDVYVR